MSSRQVGWYIRLLAYAWQERGLHLDNGLRHLAGWWRDHEEFDSMCHDCGNSVDLEGEWQQVLSMFTALLPDGRSTHPKLAEQMQEAEESYRKHAEGGRKSTEIRRRSKKLKELSSSALRSAEHSAEHVLRASESVSVISDSKSLKQEKDSELPFGEFLQAATEAGLPFSEKDMARSQAEWQRLDANLRFAAIHGLHVRQKSGEYDDPGFRPLPHNYLANRNWERPVRIKQTAQTKKEKFWDEVSQA